MILKVFHKILVSFGLFQRLENSDLSMVKDEKVNIDVVLWVSLEMLDYSERD